MDNDGIGERPFLGLINTLQCLFIICISSQSVYSFSRKRDQLSILDERGSLQQFILRKQLGFYELNRSLLDLLRQFLLVFVEKVVQFLLLFCFHFFYMVIIKAILILLHSGALFNTERGRVKAKIRKILTLVYMKIIRGSSIG